MLTPIYEIFKLRKSDSCLVFLNMDSAKEDTISIPVEHQNLVIDRIEQARINPEKMLDWDEASKELKP
jgi:hypothetical protein